MNESAAARACALSFGEAADRPRLDLRAEDRRLPLRVDTIEELRAVSRRGHKFADQLPELEALSRPASSSTGDLRAR